MRVEGPAWANGREIAPCIDRAYIQFGSADWFWERWVNSYVLQVEPLSQVGKDEAVLESAEALRVQQTRDLFFEELRDLLSAELAKG